jgi:hypothetical protein
VGEARRASARAAEISGFLPAERPAVASPGTGQAGPAFLSAETANIAAGLELLLTGPADTSAPGNVLQRLRALRGIAAIRDVPPLPDILEAADEAIRPLETQGTLTAAHRALLDAAAAMLREAARALRAAPPAGGALGPLAVSPEASARFETALGHFVEADQERMHIVPVSDLFFDDAGPHVVSETPTPPTTSPDRFRLEMVGHGEHLRRLVHDARSSPDSVTIDRSRRALRRALASVRTTAESFGEDAVADTVTALAESLSSLDVPGLAVLAGFAELLSSPGQDSQRLRTELPRLLAGRVERERAPSPARPTETTELTWIEPPQAVPPRVEAARPQPLFAAPPAANVRPYQPVSRQPQPAAPTPPPSAPAGAALASLLDFGIRSVEELAEQPLSAPVPVEETLVAIESLTYRGESAWRRALELRDDLRKQASPPRDALEELYDLLDLVTDE